MAQSIHKFVTTARSEGGFLKLPFQFDGTILQIAVLPLYDDATYDFGIKDEDGDVVFAEVDQKGALRLTDFNLVVMPGEKFFLIENATQDYIFRIKVVYKE